MSDTAVPGGGGDWPANDLRRPKHRRDGVPLDGAPDLGLFGGQQAAEPVAPATPEEMRHAGENPGAEFAG